MKKTATTRRQGRCLRTSRIQLSDAPTGDIERAQRAGVSVLILMVCFTGRFLEEVQRR